MKKQRVNSTGSDETRSATVPSRLPSRLEGRLAAYVVAAEHVRSVHLARIQAGLSEGLNSRLVARAVAAGAAGAGLLLTPELAIADIIFTPANIGLSAPTHFSTQTRNTLAIDVDRDSIPEFKFVNSANVFVNSNGVFYGANGALRASALAGGGLLIGPLAKNAPIGPRGAFVGATTMARAGIFRTSYGFGSNVGGPWASAYKYGTKTGYMGLEFVINGKEHFGWARWQVTEGSPVFPFFDATLTGYAYETVANEPIRAGQTTESPEPATLGLLALGSLGIAAWRRRRQRVANSG